jgi:hypothetical protein
MCNVWRWSGEVASACNAATIESMVDCTLGDLAKVAKVTSPGKDAQAGPTQQDEKQNKRGKSSKDPKPKAQAVETTGKKPAGTGAGRGRPRRDFKVVAENFVVQFLGCDADCSFFKGKEQYVQKTWMENLCAELDKDVAKAGDGDPAMGVLQKQVHVITDMVKHLR